MRRKNRAVREECAVEKWLTPLLKEDKVAEREEVGREEEEVQEEETWRVSSLRPVSERFQVKNEVKGNDCLFFRGNS